jgi:hypothetical protein
MTIWRGLPYVFKPGGGYRTAEAHAKNEILALRLFGAAGVRVPEEVYEVYDGTVFNGLLISYIVGASARQLFDAGIIPEGSPEFHAVYDGIERNLVIHALFANWDARNAENYMIAGATNVWDFANPYVIDLGGALMFRAMGAFDSNKFAAEGLTGGRGNIASLVEMARPGRYFSKFKGDEAARRAAICDRWVTVDQNLLLQTLDANAHLAGANYDELRRRLVERMSAITEYCGRMSGGRKKSRKSRKSLKSRKSRKMREKN